MPIDPSAIFVIYGRNTRARDELGDFLRACGLTPINFGELRAELGGTPTIGQIVEAGMERASAAIALFTPDEYAALRSDFQLKGEQEAQHRRWQPRPNVLFEAGMAFGRDRHRVVFVVLGKVGTFSDIDGIHLLRPTNDPSGDRAVLRDTLRNSLKLPVVDNRAWMTSGDFEAHVPALDQDDPLDPYRAPAAEPAGVKPRAPAPLRWAMAGWAVAALALGLVAWKQREASLLHKQVDLARAALAECEAAAVPRIAGPCPQGTSVEVDEAAYRLAAEALDHRLNSHREKGSGGSVPTGEAATASLRRAVFASFRELNGSRRVLEGALRALREELGTQFDSAGSIVTAEFQTLMQRRLRWLKLEVLPAMIAAEDQQQPWVQGDAHASVALPDDPDLRIGDQPRAQETFSSSTLVTREIELLKERLHER